VCFKINSMGVEYGIKRRAFYEAAVSRLGF
jgi:hypothetical protein